jgi:LysM domain/L,D-transpeptidase catalytic domain
MHRSALAGAVLLVVVTGCSGGDGGDGGATTETLPAPSTSAAPAWPAPPGTVALAPPVPVPVAAPPTNPPAPVCTATVQPGDSLIAIAERSAVTLEDLQAENLIDPADTIYAGQVFDVCIGNDTDDITGASRLAPPPDAVMVQQRVLNELFADLALLPLGIDGDSGKYTRQAVCAARMGLGLPVHAGHLPAGSEEEAAIFAATDLGVPAGAPTDEDRWILVDQTCQVIVTGEADRLVNIFPTSTGSDGHATFNVRARAFRFDPATDNAGWHDSSIYPVEVDNPLNGNMYKPIYFNDGQAIHGAGFIPPEPRSKGCARTFPMHQDMIIEWLGIADMTEATWNVADIGVTVVVQGRYVDPTAAEPAAG